MPVAACHPADPLWVAARKERSELPPLVAFSRGLPPPGSTSPFEALHCDVLLHWKTPRSFIPLMLTAILFLSMISNGCGGGQFAPTPSCTATSFDNRTYGGATDSRLQALWQQAQQELATQPIVLNPVAAQVQGVALQTIAPDSRANQVQPQCVAVITVPDLTVAQLQAENPGVALQHNTDPTGVIHCPEGALARYCVSFTASNNQAVYVAQSEALNFGATGWEFENIILARLGYNTAGR